METSLAAGVLPVLSLNGAYGGIVTADRGLTTLACCIRRDALQRCRQNAPLTTAGAVSYTHLDVYKRQDRYRARGLYGSVQRAPMPHGFPYLVAILEVDARRHASKPLDPRYRRRPLTRR